jgi:hypothetical protein
MNVSLRRTTLRTAMAAALGVLFVGSAALTAGVIAAPVAGSTTIHPFGAGIPPWEPDPNSVGGLIFYNSSGQQVTGGNITDSPIAAYVQGAAVVNPLDTRATLYGYLPVNGQSPGQFSGEALGATTPYPNSSAPPPLNTSTLPVETGASGDETIAELMEDFPNNDNSDDGYANMYVLRLKTSRAGSNNATYDSADILITGSTWSVVYSETTPSTTTLMASPAGPSPYGTPVTLTATVTAGATGTVQFKNGITNIGTPVTVSDGTASTSTSTLPIGTSSLTAVFSPTGGSGYTSSTGTTTYTVTPIPTTTGLQASPTSPQPGGTSVTLTATVSPSAATGTVQFQVGSTDIGAPVAVSDGVATTSTTALPVGTDTLTATFTPQLGSTYGGSSGTASYTITATPTTTGLQASPSSPQEYGTSVTLTATVSPSAATGTVQFQVGSTDIGSPVTVSGGVATTSTSTLPVGTDTLNAVFSPTNGNGYAGSSGSTSYTVTAIPTATTLSATPTSPQYAGTSVTLKATVSPTLPGTVQFEVGSSPIGSPVTVVSGIATTTTTTLPVGTDTLNALFTPTSSNYADSTGTTSYTVNALTTTTTALTTTPASPQFVGTSVTLKATVTPTATGTVQFEVGSSPIGSPVTVTGGVATTTTSTLPVGTDSLSAVFTPTVGNGFSGSTGTASFTVNPLTATSTGLQASPASPQYSGTAVTLTATVTPSAATGTIQFEVGSTHIGSPVTVTGGTAATTTSTLPVGTDTLNAVFTPTAGNGYEASTGTTTYTVKALNVTRTVVTSSANPSKLGAMVTFTATVTDAVTPTGTVTFHNGTTAISGCSAEALNGSDQATCTTSFPTGGSFPITAAYSGDPVSAPSTSAVVNQVVGRAGKGYWLVASDGGIFNYGDAAYHGSAGNVVLNKPIVGIAATPDGGGYWLVASDGGIFNYGDAGYYGSAGNVVLNKPIVGIAATPDGKGYWLVASDGGIFNYGDAGYYGSAGNVPLNKPIVGIAATPDGKGYWLVASDGGIFNYGDAAYHGSAGNVPLNKPIVGIAATPDGGGYWLVASDGGIFNYGDAGYFGSAGNVPLNQPIVGIGGA